MISGLQDALRFLLEHAVCPLVPCEGRPRATGGGLEQIHPTCTSDANGFLGSLLAQGSSTLQITGYRKAAETQYLRFVSMVSEASFTRIK